MTKESVYRKKSERSKYKLEDKTSHSHSVLVLKFWGFCLLYVLDMINDNLPSDHGGNITLLTAL